MWSQILLCLLVGVAYASENPGWDENKLYVYQVRGRSLASLDQISNFYNGIIWKALMHIQPTSDGNLNAKVTNSQYAPINSKLSDGWETEIPDSEANFKKLQLSEKPFEIVLVGGAIRNIKVNSQIKNWEANIIKSIVSQLQLDTNATNLIQSSINILTQEDSNTAVFKTMEETVTGVAETLYEIHPFPEYVLQSEPWIVPIPVVDRFHQQYKVIEIVKTKNFTVSPHSPSYHAGLEGISGYQPGVKIGEFMSRTSRSQAVITGTLKQFTIQSSVTSEHIALSPTLGDKQKGSVNSKMNLTLHQIMEPLSGNQFQVDNPVDVGVVYGYNSPYGTENGPRPAKPFDHNDAPNSAESQSSSDNSNFSPRSRSRSYSRRPRAAYDTDEEDWYQQKPKLSEAPSSPLLPLTVGYDGQSFKKQKNIVEIARRLIKEIARESSHPQEILKEYTPGKFLVLTSLVRTMNDAEMKQVTNDVYSKSSADWPVYRDAVVQSGTGPALSNLKDWIQNEKVSNFEAAQLIASTANAARAPTEEYMESFNGIIQDDDIMSKPYLNVSALLSYTTLVRKVYVNQQESQGKYPSYSYGSFNTESGQEYVKNNVIPHLTTHLQQAIIKADTQKIHAYIRALGNIGEQHILHAFKPYLEGETPASHFQRLLMVIALDKLVESNPLAARSVSYKIYQNPSEAEPVRVAAVYQLMRTRPSPAMLQRMAEYTNVDASNYVNSAVKSSIESASELEAPEDNEFRAAAESARPLVTSQEFGAQFSQNYLRSFVEEENYDQSMQTYGGEDHVLPKGMEYKMSRQIGGVSQPIFVGLGVTSSVEDLLNFLQQQTKEYQRQQKEKEAQNAGKYSWSSQYVAKLLNLQNEPREQLEGNAYLEVGALQALLSIDNHTLENLPQGIQELEQKLRQNQKYKYSKMMISQESSLALPTVLGVPFVYTYDRPILVNVEASLQAKAEPNYSTGQILQQPDTVEAEFTINAVVSGRVQSQFGIFTPFDHQRYSAGYNKNFQVVVPLAGKLQLNLKNHVLKAQVQNPGNEKDIRVGHFSSWPYTSQDDAFSPKPNYRIIRASHPHIINMAVGGQSTGVAVTLDIESDQVMDAAYLYDKFSNRDPVSAILNPWDDTDIQFLNANLGIDSAKSSTQEVTLRLAYKTAYQANEQTGGNPDLNQTVSKIPPFANDPDKRQQEFVDRLSPDINNVQVLVGDATVEFQGQSTIEYSLTVGVAKSNVNPLSRFLALVREVKEQVPKSVAYAQGFSIVPNTNGLNLDYAMKMNKTLYGRVQILTGQGEQIPPTVDASIKLYKSKERVQHLKEQEDYKECKQQMQQGNTQLPICAKVTAEANLLDQFEIQVQYVIDERLINSTYNTYSVMRHHLYPRVEENILARRGENLLAIRGQFSPDLESVNATISSAYGGAEVRNAKVNQWTRKLLVSHPVFHAGARLQGQALKQDTYRPICVVDKTHTSTFDNKTYPSSFSDAWTVVMQYVPHRPSPKSNKPNIDAHEQLKLARESYAILAQASRQGSSEKVILISLQMPGTQGQLAKIQLTPSPGKSPKAFVNDQEVKYTNQSSSDFYGGHIQIYGLNEEEVKVEVADAFYVIFNGRTLKITAVNSKFRDSSRGLCGTFTGEPDTDFTGPDNCIAENPQNFVRSWHVLRKPPQSRSASASQNDQQVIRKCYQKKIVFAKYISSRDEGLASGRRGGDDSCTAHMSRYEEREEQFCVSIRALPVCKPGCASLQKITKSIDVHCRPPSPNTGFWRAQLDKGNHMDFTMMPKTGELQMELPARCLSKN